MLDLNRMYLENDGNFPGNIEDCSTQNDDASIRVYFRDLENRLIDYINGADIVLGCVAWLTSTPILRALARKESVSIVVQKEDFLRPDINENNNWKVHLRGLYQALNCSLYRYMFEGSLLTSVSVASDPGIDPVRCVGNYNQDRNPAFPRMHNKFLLFCRLRQLERLEALEDGYSIIVPYAVWTGSFNLTRNAGMSLENAIVVQDTEIVRAYYREFAQILALSESLNWEHEWTTPEWRIGT